MPSHNDIHHAYLDKKQEILNAAAYMSVWNAFKFIEKTTVFGKLDELRVYNETFKTQERNSCSSLDSVTEHHMQLGNTMEKMKSCYNGIADDLLLLAAFEHLMCFKLLTNGYVIHDFKKRRLVTDIDSRTQKLPLDSLKTTAQVEHFKDSTFNGSVLLMSDYISLLTSNESEVKGLNDLKDRRNKAHFDSKIYSFGVHNEDFFAATRLILDSVSTEFSELFPMHVKAN
ncbi:MAG: hypothetical protein JKY55_05950 [Aliivibrio sp.]|uniref:hypothetical protein n=1 Tax=Aliivibrio sp. TaxID=1872443 RepID=UPI001A519C5A|nr:hypothetical protein [Aliivibrio sp.]